MNGIQYQFADLVDTSSEQTISFSAKFNNPTIMVIRKLPVNDRQWKKLQKKSVLCKLDGNKVIAWQEVK